MWYRLSQSQNADAEAEREMLDMTGGVRSRKGSELVEPQEQVQIPVEPEPPITEHVIDEPVIDEPANEDTFTDYTPPSTAEENQVNQVQDMYRAEDLDEIFRGAGVQYPMHESCRCRIQFRPDDSNDDLLVPRWEVSSGACDHCLNAQRIFNQYVEQTGVRVQLPNSGVA